MIDDMNVATHACLRFVIARQSDDTITYQDYLARAVDHLQQAKSIVDADEGADPTSGRRRPGGRSSPVRLPQPRSADR